MHMNTQGGLINFLKRTIQEFIQCVQGGLIDFFEVLMKKFLFYFTKVASLPKVHFFTK